MANRASYKKAKYLAERDVDPKEYTNISACDKLKKYKDVALEKFGEAYDPVKEPIDTEVLMISGGGRPHGASAMGDGLIRCPYTLPQIKARQTSSSPAIRTRARPVDLGIEDSYVDSDFNLTFFCLWTDDYISNEVVVGCS